MARIKTWTFGADYELWDADRDTGIEVERTADDDVIRFSIGGLTDTPVRWDSTSLIFNNNNEVLPTQFKGTVEDDLVYIDPTNDSVGFGTSNTTFIYQQVGGSPFTSNPRIMIEIGPDGNDTGFVMRSWSDTPSKAGLVEFMRAGAGKTVPLQFYTVGGFRAGVWDGVKHIGSTGLFFSLEQDAALNFAPIGCEFKAGDGINPAFSILRGTYLGNVGIRTSSPIAEVTFEGNFVSNYSQAAKSFRHAGNSLANLFTVDGTNGYVEAGGISAGSIVRFTQSLIQFNRLNGDIDYQFRTTSYNKFFWIDSGLNVGGFGSTFGTEWLRISPNAVTINETGDALTVLRVEGDTDQNLLRTSPSNNRVGIGVASPLYKLDVGGTMKSMGRVKTTVRVTGGPYTINDDEDVIYVDTDGGAITINLPAGTAGRTYKIINVGSSGNNVTLTPNGAEAIYGAAASQTITDGNSITITYQTIEGWW